MKEVPSCINDTILIPMLVCYSYNLLIDNVQQQLVCALYPRIF